MNLLRVCDDPAILAQQLTHIELVSRADTLCNTVSHIVTHCYTLSDVHTQKIINNILARLVKLLHNYKTCYPRSQALVHGQMLESL